MSLLRYPGRKISALVFGAVLLNWTVLPVLAVIDANLQMQLGNATGATVDPNNHSHYLIQRTVYALDYNDTHGQPNWVSWTLSANDTGLSGRTEAWSVDNSLPPTFYKVPTATFGSVNGQAYDRGHMCPSGDRTDTAANNALTFIMSNIIPQAAQQNRQAWANLESYSRTLTDSQELLIMCGPSNFGSETITAGYVRIPSNTWKVIVCAPLGSGTAYDRITNANPASIRVIAVKIPNTDAAGVQPWSNFITSTKQLRNEFGYNFFNALPNNLAWVLRSKVDGQTPPVPSLTSFSPASGAEGSSVTISGMTLDTITNVLFNGTLASYTITETNQISAVVPDGASTGPITIRGLGGTAASASAFTVAALFVPNFTVTPVTTFSSTGFQGGPFSPSSQVYSINNTNSSSLSWGATKNSSWLSVAPTSGTLAGGSSMDVTASVSVAANSLAVGTYFDTMTFSNAVTGAKVQRTANLSVLSPPLLAINPPTEFSSSGANGGPFSPSSTVYTLNNTGSATLNWTANKSVNWLNLSSLGGSLAAGASTVVTASINSAANTLPIGTFTDQIGFTNTTNGAGSATRAVSLTVTPPNPAQLNVTPFTGFSASGPVGGPFDPQVQAFTVSNAGSVTMNWTANKTASWLSLSTTSGALAGGVSLVVTASINSAANSLPIGNYSDVIGFTNITNGAGDTRRTVNLIVNSPNPAHLDVTPANDIIASGSVGGPFNPAVHLYTLSNTGSMALNWNTGVPTNWVNLSATSGTLPAGGSTNVSVSFTAAANTFTAGVYTSTVTFTNLTNASGTTTRGVTLAVATTTGLKYVLDAPKCVSLFGTASGGVSVGPVLAGYSFDYKATGCIGLNYYPRTCNGPCNFVDADGRQYGQGGCGSAFTGPFVTTGMVCPGLIQQSLVGKIGNTCIQLGSEGSFVAPASGTLVVYLNDDSFPNNVGSFQVCLSSDFTASGPVGGPFTPESRSYPITNTSFSTLTWSVGTSVNWLSVSPASGTLAPGASTNFVVSVNANASSLASGSYSDSIYLTDTSAGLVAGVRSVSLVVTEVSADGFFDDVENGMNGWSASGLWHIVDTNTCGESVSTSHSWWYGADATCSYNTGSANSGDLISPAFVVLGSGTLTFQSWEQTEGIETEFDQRIVHITTNGAASWHQLLQSTNNAAAWRTHTINLAPYAGKVARIRFHFNTVDDSQNDYRGWYVDDIRMTGLGGGFRVTPTSAFTSSGPQGGGFSPFNAVYTLSNTGNGSISWSATSSANWLGISNPTSGVLATGAQVNVTTVFSSAANSLTPGTYTSVLAISNRTANSVVTRVVNLTVLVPATLSVSPVGDVNSSGLTGGPFSPATQNYNLFNTGSVSMNWTAKKSASWLTLSLSNGTLAAGANTNVLASITGTNLAAGSYSEIIGFTNTTSNLGNTGRAVNLTVIPKPANIVADVATLAGEGCTQTNGVADPNETVSFNFGLRNIGEVNTVNLVATLLPGSGVTSPSAPQTYGVVVAGGAPVAKSFSLITTGSCGGIVTAVLQLQDGASNLGTISYTFWLGRTSGVFSQNFDSVTAPALPAGWTTTATGAQSNWMTSIAAADTAPNAVFAPDAPNPGVNELVSPIISITGTNAQLTFRHKYSLAITNATVAFSGGVLEIKLGSGSYTDILAAGGSFVSGSYNSVLTAGFGNSLAGRSAWSGDSGGFTSTVVNLPIAAAGQNVQFRWRCASGSTPPPPSSGALAYWSFNSASSTAGVVAAHVSASLFTNVNASVISFVDGSPTTNQAISATAWKGLSGPSDGTNSYWTFNLTPASGFRISLSSFDFLDRSSLTGPTNMTVQISQDPSFATTIFNTGLLLTHQNSTATVLGTNSFPLSNSGLTGTTYVRIYGYKAGGSSGAWRLDDVVLKGTVNQILDNAGWYIDSISLKDAVCCSSANPPVASFTATPRSGVEPLLVNFTDTSVGNITSRFWNFGDGSTTNLTTNAVAHVYSAGNQNVMLVVTGPDGVSTNHQAGYISVLTPYQAWVSQFINLNDPSATANADPDGDGMSNLEEFMTGTDPTNSASFFGIISIVPEGNNLRVTWRTGAQKTNALEWGGDMAITNVLAVYTNTVPPSTNYLDVGAVTNVPGRFYRIRLVP